MLKPDLFSRVASAGVSATINLAVLATLFTYAPKAGLSGIPKGEQEALVVTLIPLDNMSRAADPVGDSASRAASPTADVEMAEMQTAASAKDAAQAKNLISPSSGKQTIEVRPLALGASAGADTVNAKAGAVRTAFEEVLRAHVRQFQLYPIEARRQGAEGVVKVHFAIGRDGKILTAWVETTSGSMILDTAALNTIRRAQPLPSIPTELPDELEITLPIDFALPRKTISQSLSSLAERAQIASASERADRN